MGDVEKRAIFLDAAVLHGFAARQVGESAIGDEPNIKLKMMFNPG